MYRFVPVIKATTDKNSILFYKDLSVSV